VDLKSDGSSNSPQDWVGYDATGSPLNPSGYIFQNIPTGESMSSRGKGFLCINEVGNRIADYGARSLHWVLARAAKSSFRFAITRCLVAP